MSSEDVFHQGEGFLISAKIEGDPIVWTEPSITALSEALIVAEPGEKIYFFTKSFKGRGHYVFPSYFLDPKDSFDASNKVKATELFNVIETYGEDGEPLKEFVGKLIHNNVLVKDNFQLLKCNKCDCLTIGTGLFCNGCGKQFKDVSKRRQIYFLPRIVKDLFYQPGKIIEGVIYHSLKGIANEEIKIGMNLSFKEEGFKGEIDIAVKNIKNGKLLIVHITTSPKDSREWEQFSKTLKHGIKTIFVTTSPDGDAEKLKVINTAFGNQGTIFWNIANDSNFFGNIKKEILSYIQ